MTQNEGELEQIELYLEGKLSKEETAAFVEKLENDPVFAKKVAEYKNILAGIDEYGQDKFINQVRGWEEALAIKEEPPRAKLFPLKKYLAWTAVLLLVLIPFGYWLVFQNTPSPTNQELFALYFKPYDDLTNNRSSEANEIQEQGMEFYNRGNYAEAISFLERYRVSQPNEPAVNFYLGISYLATGQTDKAVPSFKKVITQGESLFVEAAEWNLALTYLKAEDITDLKAQLQLILSEPEHPYHSQATELYERIK